MRATVGVAAAIALASGAQAWAAEPLSLEAISTRPDLVSGGDVLLRIRGGAGGELSVNGRIVPGALHAAPDGDGMLAMVEGLKEGRNRIAVRADGRSARLRVVNHSAGGPLFSGPQIQPWTCRAGAVDARCARPTEVRFVYMPAAGGEFKDYDPARPPADVATTTTLDGVTAPFVVRVESFTQNRSGVSVAALYDPARPWTAWAPQKSWNRGLFVLQGSGCGTGFSDQPAGSPLNAKALGQGFVVGAAALLHNTLNCNHVVQAESALMLKEHVAERYGPIEMTFGMGSSGGAISQIADQNAYPGLYDGIILNHLFVDSDASRMAAYDCKVVYDAWGKAKTPWTEAQKSAVVGMISGCDSHTTTTRYEVYNPAVGTNCTAPDSLKYDPVRNRKGVRCTLQDYQVNLVGKRRDGFANGRIDNEGVQYGLKAVLAGTITPAQFVELNANIGGHDIDFQRTAARTVADKAGLRRLYATGVDNTANNLAATAIIETRLFATDFHQPFHADVTRARLVRAQGHHDNYALWRTTKAREAAFDSSFDVMVQWLRAIRADKRAVPTAQKVVEHRPELARDRCVIDGKDQQTSACPRPPELARVLAGAPDTNDIGKCQLKPLDRAEYRNVKFTDEEWAQLNAVFPHGVCNYNRPLVGFRMTTPWLRYQGDGRARPMASR